MVHTLHYEAGELSFTLHRRNRKTMSIHVRPDMSIEVMAPLKAELDRIYEAVAKRAHWITKKINFLKQLAPQKMKSLYEEGEAYLYLGEWYQLKTEQSVKAEVLISDQFIILGSHYPSKKSLTHELLREWFISEAKKQFMSRLEIVLRTFPNPELVAPKTVIVRLLSSRWGSMSNKGSMTLNSRLIHASVESIDYVIVHELCHRVHFNHSKAFWNLVGSVMPNWRERKKKLESEFYHIPH